MKKLDEIKSLNDIDYADYLNYKQIVSAKKVKLVGKKEVLFLTPIVAGLASLGLLSVSVWFLMLSMPIICTGLFFAPVAFHSIYVNFCKRSDAKLRLDEFRRLKSSKALANIANLMAEYELTDRFQIEKLMFEIKNLKSEIGTAPSLSANDRAMSEFKRQELLAKEYLLNQITKKSPAVSGKKQRQLEGSTSASNALNLTD